MSWRPAKSITTLLRQVNEANPQRDKTSDGIVGDLSHKARKSDHNPNGLGVVTAIDIDEDLSPGQDATTLVNALQASRDPRIKYIIYEGRITVKGDVTRWKKYSGTNPHNHHFHLSVSSDRSRYDDASEWDLTGSLVAEIPHLKPEQPTLRRGAKGEAVKRLQMALRARGAAIKADGDFGKATMLAVKDFQKAQGLFPDGVAGRRTNAVLGL